MRSNRYKFLILSLLLFLFGNSYSQRYFVKTYTIGNGLPTRNIHDACQDSSGIMWFATSSGITKYDGFSFTNFSTANGIPDQLFKKIKIDEKGIIWAMPEFKSDTIIYLENNHWNKILPPPRESQNPRMNAFDVLYRNNKPIVCMGSFDGYYIYENNSWKHFRISKNDTLNYVYTVIAYEKHFLLSTKSGLCTITDGNTDWSLTKLIEPYGTDVIAINVEDKNSADEKIWVLTEKWLGYIQYHKFTMVTTKFRLPHPTIFYYSFVNSDKKGNVIFGNIWAKYFISKKSSTPSPLMIVNGFSSDGATSVFVDREQNFWITDTRGINKINNLKVVNYFEKNGMLEDEVTAVAELKNGKIVFGHNIGLSIYDNSTFKKISFPPSKENTRRVQDMITDKQGNAWFISTTLGLGRITPDGSIKWYHSDKYPTMTAVHQDNNGRIWVGADRKLLYIEGDKLVEHKQFGDDKNTIRKIFTCPSGGILIAGLEGLWHLDGSKIEKIPSPPGRIAESVFSYLKGSDGAEYVGTKNGLFAIENGRITKFTKNGIDIKSPIFFILQDNEQNYWLGSNQGVYKWDGHSKIETYNILNGLAGWETNRAAGVLDSKGRVWVGTDRGVSCFEPDYDNVSVPTPAIQLINVEDSKGSVHDLMVKSTISFSDNTLTFHFRGISFLNEQLIEYKYKLEGFDKEWQDATQSMLDKVKYIGLRPGKYTFCVKAKNFSGEWSGIARSATIKISAPVYLRWWFLVLAFLVLSVIIYGIIRMYIQKMHNARLEKEIIERKRIEQALIESRQKYQDLVQLLPETIYESDCNGRIGYMNDTGFRLFGYKQEDLNDNLNLKQFIEPGSVDEIAAHIKCVHEHKSPSKTVVTGIKKDGTVFPISIHTVPILVNQKCLGARGIIIDLTEQKRFEEQLQQNAEDLKALNNSKDKLFSIIAHDLRSPFTSFLGFTEMLDEEFNILPESELQTIITSMRKSASNLYQLLENLLEWSLLQREITRFYPKSEFLFPLVRNCIEIISVSAKLKGIDITIDIPRSLEVTVDVHMLQTIIRNLTSNAVKFTKRGGSVLISAHAIEEQSVMISVKDTGIGIRPEMVKELFSLDTSYKTKGTEGELSTGLGLILCKEFVEKHKGKIWVESEVDKGSTFYFTFKDFTAY